MADQICPSRKLIILLPFLLLCSQLSAQILFTGEIKRFGGNFPPVDYELCEGQLLPVSEFPDLFDLIGTIYGGDGVTNFALPDLRGRVPMGIGQGPGLTNRELGERGGVEDLTLSVNHMPFHTHSAEASSLPGSSANPGGSRPAVYPGGIPGYGTAANSTTRAGTVQSSGLSQPYTNLQSYLPITHIIATGLPSESSQPYLGDILLVAFNNIPAGWAECDGQLLPVISNQTLFVMLGSAFGGNGVTNFGLPDLRGRVPVGAGNTEGRGITGGAETHILTVAEMPAHTHLVTAAPAPGSSASPKNNFPARDASGAAHYAPSTNTSLSANAVSATGGGQPYPNMKPYLGLHYIICIDGLVPPPGNPRKTPK